MKALVEYLAQSLVDDPASVHVEEKATDEVTTLALSVKKEDLGKVIGKKGRTVKAMRILLEAFGKPQNKRFALEIVEPKEEAPAAPTTDS